MVAFQTDILTYLEMKNPRKADMEQALRKDLQAQSIAERITELCRSLGKDIESKVIEFLGLPRTHHQMLQELATLSAEKRGGGKSRVIRRVFCQAQFDVLSGILPAMSG